jgi:hypothetical protein
MGALDFGAGTDVFTNSGTGVFNLDGDTSLVGLETFTNSGQINLDTFTLTGPPVTLTNAGTIDTNGSTGIRRLHRAHQYRHAGPGGGDVHRPGGRVHQHRDGLRR